MLSLTQVSVLQTTKNVNNFTVWSQKAKQKLLFHSMAVKALYIFQNPPQSMDSVRCMKKA